MTHTISMLRAAANEYAILAAKPNIDNAMRFGIGDVVAQWHALARNATNLCKRSKELAGGCDVECLQCGEACFRDSPELA